MPVSAARRGCSTARIERGRTAKPADGGLLDAGGREPRTEDPHAGDDQRLIAAADLSPSRHIDAEPLAREAKARREVRRAQGVVVHRADADRIAGLPAV